MLSVVRIFFDMSYRSIWRQARSGRKAAVVITVTSMAGQMDEAWLQLVAIALFLTTLLELRFETLFGQVFGFLDLSRRHTLRHMVPVLDDFRF